MNKSNNDNISNNNQQTANLSNQNTNMMNNKDNRENPKASQDVTHTLGKGVATHFGGGIGNKIYDEASKTKLGQKIEKNASKQIDKNPIASKVANGLSSAGITDKANNAIDALGFKSGGKGFNSNLNKGAKSTNKKLNNNNFSINNPIRSRSSFNQEIPSSDEIGETPDFENMTPEEIEDYRLKQEELEQINQEKEKKAKNDKRKKQIKSIIEFFARHPQLLLIVGIALLIVFVLIILIYMISSDMDLVGNRGVGYDTAEQVSGYCENIILIKEHDDFSGAAVASIDDVNLEETFRLNNRDVKRYEYQTYSLEEYVKGVLQAETSIIKEEKTYEVAAIVARTYAVEIANKNCYVWDNNNKRSEYKNPQNFNHDNIDSDISEAVSKTTGLIAYDKDNIIDMSQDSYYDYFCYSKITNATNEEQSYYEMLQENEEENLLISVDWTKDNNNVADGDAKKWNFSGKYNGGGYNNNCQKKGLSLYGAKYLLNKEYNPYDTIRVLMYYYTYDLELKKVGSFIASDGCFWWPTDGTIITSRFGLREAPTAGASTNHGAIDIAVSQGTNVYATSNGKVTVAGAVSGYGYAVYIDHGNGIVSRYGHLKADGIKVSVGQSVSAGDIIALSGNTGVSTGPHLHFEIRLNDVKVDPLNYVSPTDQRPTCTNSGGTIVDTGENSSSVCMTLKNNGFTSPQIGGIMANLFAESGFNPTAFNPGGGGAGAYGIAQWRGKRQEALKSLANYDTLGVQLSFLLSELNSSESAAKSALLSSGADANSLAYVFCSKYERPEGTICTARQNSGNGLSYSNYATNNCS